MSRMQAVQFLFLPAALLFLVPLLPRHSETGLISVAVGGIGLAWLIVNTVHVVKTLRTEPADRQP